MEPASGPRRRGRSSRPRRSPLRARFATRRFLSTERETRASELVARAPVRRMASGAADRSATDHGASLAFGSKSRFWIAAGRSSSSSTPWSSQSFAFILSSIFMMPCSRFMSYLAVIMLRFWPPDMFDVGCRRGRAFDEVSRCGATTRTASTTGSPTGAGQRRHHQTLLEHGGCTEAASRTLNRDSSTLPRARSRGKGARYRPAAERLVPSVVSAGTRRSVPQRRAVADAGAPVHRSS